MGAPDDVVSRARERADRVKPKSVSDDFEVWDDCIQAVEFFQSLRGEWAHISGMTVARTGIPSTRLRASMELQGIPRRRRRQLFEDIKLMESAVLTFDHERREAARAEKGTA